jgi:hypothetical protein
LAGRIPARLTAAEGRKFALVVGGALLVLGLLLWRRGHGTGGIVAAALAGALLLAGLAAPTRLGPVYRGWMALAHAISKVTTPVVMSIIFFLVLTPAGLLARLAGHRPLLRKSQADTYWHSRPAGERRGDMNHQF